MLITKLEYICSKFKVSFNDTCVRIHEPNKYNNKIWDEVIKSPIYYSEAESFHTLTSYIRDAMKGIDTDLGNYNDFHVWMHETYELELENIYRRGRGVAQYDNIRTGK